MFHVPGSRCQLPHGQWRERRGSPFDTRYSVFGDRNESLERFLRLNELSARAKNKLENPRIKSRIRGIRASTKYRALGVSETLRKGGVSSGKAVLRKNYRYYYKEESKKGRVAYRDLVTGRFIKKPKGLGVLLKVK